MYESQDVFRLLLAGLEDDEHRERTIEIIAANNATQLAELRAEGQPEADNSDRSAGHPPAAG